MLEEHLVIISLHCRDFLHMEFSNKTCYISLRFHAVLTVEVMKNAVKGLALCQPFYYLQTSSLE